MCTSLPLTLLLPSSSALRWFQNVSLTLSCSPSGQSSGISHMASRWPFTLFLLSSPSTVQLQQGRHRILPGCNVDGICPCPKPCHSFISQIYPLFPTHPHRPHSLWSHYKVLLCLRSLWHIGFLGPCNISPWTNFPQWPPRAQSLPIPWPYYK